MSVPEVFADGIGKVRIVGDTVRIDLVSLGDAESGYDTRVRLIVPASAITRMAALLAQASDALASAKRREPAAGD